MTETITETHAQQLSMQCRKLGQRAQTADDWRKAIEAGEQAVAAIPEAPEPRFNLAVARLGLARATGTGRLEAAQAFDDAREKCDPHALVQYLATAVQLLEKRAAQLGGDPAYEYAMGTHLAALGKNAKARRALEACTSDAELGELAAKALAEVPEPVLAKAPPVGRNDPCPCGSGKKYKKCHGA